jgi:hypothetical protein
MARKKVLHVRRLILHNTEELAEVLNLKVHFFSLSDEFSGLVLFSKRKSLVKINVLKDHSVISFIFGEVFLTWNFL